LKGREPAWQEVARTGDADKGQYITEMTLESLAEKACVYQKGFMIEL
jgi:hypothetical protein